MLVVGNLPSGKGELSMKRFWGSTPLFLFALLLFAVHPASAQKITGDLNGTVTDASGAAVPNAKVVAENLGTKAVREASTTETGAYRITELQPGQYKLTVTAQGFKTFTREAQVATGQITTSDFALAVGALSETITVEASTPIIEFNDRLNSYVDKEDRKSTRLNSSHIQKSRMPSSA